MTQSTQAVRDVSQSVSPVKQTPQTVSLVTPLITETRILLLVTVLMAFIPPQMISHVFNVMFSV